MVVLKRKNVIANGLGAKKRRYSETPTVESTPADIDDQVKPKKRVSFASTLSQAKSTDDILGESVSPSAGPPSPKKRPKGILRTQNKRNTPSQQFKRKSAAEVDRDGGEQQTSSDSNAVDENSSQRQATNKRSRMDASRSAAGIPRVTRNPLAKTFKIKVKRSTKEMLSQMTKKERKQFIRKLSERNKPEFQLITQAKNLWETIRNHRTKPEESEACIEKLLGLVTGKLAKIVYKHDACRIVQCLISLKRENIRDRLFDELTPEIVRMAKDRYANFFVRKMLKYGSRNQKDTVINAFRGHVVGVFRFLYGARILELAYNDYANAEQRNRIVSEFYGPEFVLFANEIPPSQLSISFVATTYPEKIPIIMANLEKTLNSAIEKIQNLKHSLLHKLLLDYLNYCTSDQKRGIVVTLKDQLPEIAHTMDGSRAALICIWSANEDERKAIVKSLTGLVVNCCKDHFARRLLFAIFDVVDDTKRVNKLITQVIAENLSDLIYNKSAVWVLHYLVRPRDHHVFGKGLIEILQKGDTNEFTKRSAEERYRELFECVRDKLLDFMAVNMREIIGNKISAVLVLDTLEPYKESDDPFLREIPTDQRAACFRAIAELVGDEFIPHPVESAPHIIEAGAGRFVLRKLLQTDPRQTGVKLSDFIAELPSEQLGSFTAINPGCFALLEMATSGSQKARAAVEAAVSLKQLQNSSLVGARALLEELTGQNQQKSQIHPAGIKKERKPMPGKRSSGNGSSAKKRSSTANHFSKPRIG